MGQQPAKYIPMSILFLEWKSHASFASANPLSVQNGDILHFAIFVFAHKTSSYPYN